MIVRVPDGTAQAGRILDAGAHGVIVPQVGSPAEAAAAGRAVRYAGARGISPFSRGNRYGAAGADFRPRADERVACIVQIERASALAAVEEIAALHLASAVQAAGFRGLGFTMFSCTFESALRAAASSAAAGALKSPG